MPLIYDFVNKIDSGVLRVVQQFFKTLPLILSGPKALLGLRVLRTANTRSGSKSICQSSFSLISMGML